MSAWKACDIRGVYPDEVSPELLRDVGGRIPALLTANPRILVAGDFRLSTPVLKSALLAGLLSAGAHVLDAGQIPTPIAYFAHRQYLTDAALVVTASHNPAGHNGLKLMIGSLPPSEADLNRLRNSAPAPGSSGGHSEQIGATASYIDWIERRWTGIRSHRRLRVVLDPGNGAWSDLAPPIFERLGFDVLRLFCNADGRFPNRRPDCARAENLGALSDAVRYNGADLGIAWDGDGDRVAFADESGRVVSTDAVSVLLVQNLLQRGTGQAVVYDIKLSHLVEDTVTGLGGIPVVERSGHAFIKRAMMDRNALFGCELSGHYFYRELQGGDDGLFSALLLAEIVQRHGALGSLTAELPEVFITPDLRVPETVSTLARIHHRIREAFPQASETTIDGVRLASSDGFVLIRQSITEPVITMRMEGFDEAGLKRLIDGCVHALPELDEPIREQIRQRQTT